MEYDSRPRTALFSIRDKDSETKELFFIGRKIISILGLIIGAAVALIVYFFSENILISLGIGIAVGLPIGVFPVLGDQKKEEYFRPLMEKMVELLDEVGIELSTANMMDLLSFKEFRISNEHVLVSETKDGYLTVYIATDVLPEKVKTKKPDTFPVVVTQKATLDTKHQDKPGKHSLTADEASITENSKDDIEPEVKDENKGNEVSSEDKENPGESVDVSVFVTSEKSHTPVSTGAIDIVSPDSKKNEPTIGEIAPGVTGPIPITVGYHSLIGAEDTIINPRNYAKHADPYAEPLTDPVPVQLVKRKHGRRSATQ